VIEGLCEELRTPVCVFYLVLRALDTVEDDIHIPREMKDRHLANFHKYLVSPDAVPDDLATYGDGGYLELMQQYRRVVKTYLRCSPAVQEVISNGTKRMADGMLEYLDVQGKVEKKREYDVYCFYVAGVVGLGLSDLFAVTGLEPALRCTTGPCHLAASTDTVDRSYGPTHTYDAASNPENITCAAVAMGLLLQKTNIVRDYLEDINDKRLWWPAEVWRCWTTDPETFRDGNAAALGCLNQLVTDALRHVAGCNAYLALLTEPTVFFFCAVPQAMAIATMAHVFNNPTVFTGVVKVTKAEACEAMAACKDMKTYTRWARRYTSAILARCQEDPVRFAEALPVVTAADEAFASA